MTNFVKYVPSNTTNMREINKVAKKALKEEADQWSGGALRDRETIIIRKALMDHAWPLDKAALLRSLAAIEESPSDWNQGTWRCATGMCMAGFATSVVGGLQWYDEDPNAVYGEYVSILGAPVSAAVAADAILGLPMGHTVFEGTNTLPVLRHWVSFFVQTDYKVTTHTDVYNIPKYQEARKGGDDLRHTYPVR